MEWRALGLLEQSAKLTTFKEKGATMSELLQYENFDGREGESFVFSCLPDDDGNVGQPVTLELVNVIAHNRLQNKDDENLQDGDGDAFERKRKMFTLIFHGPEDAMLAEGVHPVTHDDFEDLDLFVCCNGNESGHLVYEAAFN